MLFVSIGVGDVAGDDVVVVDVVGGVDDGDVDVSESVAVAVSWGVDDGGAVSAGKVVNCY
jgi:hypothetical protein